MKALASSPREGGGGLKPFYNVKYEIVFQIGMQESLMIIAKCKLFNKYSTILTY